MGEFVMIHCCVCGEEIESYFVIYKRDSGNEKVKKPYCSLSCIKNEQEDE